MKSAFIIRLLKLISVLAFFVFILIFLINRKTGSKTVSQTLNNKTDYPYFDKHLFYEGINYTQKNNAGYPKKIRGGIVPHHLLPGFMQADFFSKLSGQKPETVIILGPNHSEKGNSEIQTGQISWETPFGTVTSEKTLINTLITQNLAGENPGVLSEEYSIGSLIPYIKYYLPESRIVPLILKRNLNTDKLNRLSAILAQYMKNKNSILIASVDFSHYLTSKKAFENDKTTIGLIQNHEYGKILRLDSGYLDSPSSIVLLLLSMKNFGISKFDILLHVNSGDLQKKIWGETTSYFTIAYYE